MIDVLDFADKAARCVLGGRRCWTEEDWQDAVQEAAVGILEALQKSNHAGYCFRAGQRQIYEWMRAWLRSYPRGGTLLDYLEYAQIDNDPHEVDIDLHKLRIMLQSQRAEKSDEDIAYIELRMAGRSTAGIAMELGISERNVYAIRERLLPRLERIARGENPPPTTRHVRESSKAALARINSDPELLKRRGDAIRTAKARRKE